MGNTIEHLDSLFTTHVAPYTSQVASSQPTRQCTCATNDHRLHPCYVPSQSQVNHPSLMAFPPVPIPPPNPSNRAFPPSVSPKIPPPHFYQISLPSALSPTAKMILWNVMGWVRNGHAHFRC